MTDGRGFNAKFEIDPFRKFCLLEGLDDIGLTLRHAEALDKFETKHDEVCLVEGKVRWEIERRTTADPSPSAATRPSLRMTEP